MSTTLRARREADLFNEQVQSLVLVELFGGLQLRHSHQSVTRFRTQKTATLLAYLAFHADRMHARDMLSEMFWGDKNAQGANLNLSVALSSLRGALQSIGVEEGALRTERYRVGLNPQLVTTDVARFEQLLNRSDSLPEAEAAPLLQSALALYQGPFLPAQDDHWVVGYQVRFAERFFAASRRLSQVYFHQGDVVSGLTCLRRVFHFDQTHIEVARCLIQACLEANQPGEAARTFHELHQALVTSDDAAFAEAALADLYPIIEPHLNTYQRRTATGTGLRKRGRKPGRTDERLMKASPGASVELLLPTSPARTLAADPVARTLPSSLPLPLTRFFGREDEMLRLGWLLGDPSARLIALTGLGGVGKTRLALSVAHERYQRRTRGNSGGGGGNDNWNTDVSPFPELAEPEPGAMPPSDSDVLFLSLTDTDIAARLPELLAEHLGVHLPERSEEDSGNLSPDCSWTLTALNMLSVALAARPGLLLILDNIDGLIETHVPAFLERLLLHCVQLTLLVTSRRHLPIAGARDFPVTPLAPPPDTQASETSPDVLIAQWPSLALFVDRARTAHPGFQLTQRSLPDVVQLVRRLEGLPLAVELAAARCQVMTPRQILLRMEHRFELLVSAHHGTPDRRHSLQESLRFSYRLLTPHLQAFFAQLSVFRGSFTLDAASAIANDPLASDHLAQLADASFVQVDAATAEADTESDEVYFTQLETLREFAAEQLALLPVHEQQATHERHARFWLETAEQAKPHLSGPERPTWLRRLIKAHLNVQTALNWCLAAGENAPTRRELALRFGAALTPFWHFRGMHGEGARHLRTILECWGERADSLLPVQQDRATSERLAQMWNGVGVFKMNRGDWDGARAAYNRGLLLWQEIGDARGIAATRNNRAILEQQTGDLEIAEAEYQASLTWWRQAGDQANVSRVLNNLSILATWQGRHQDARVTLTESLTIARQSGDSLGFATRLHNLGVLAIEYGKDETARSYFENSLKHGHSGGKWILCAYNVVSLALLRLTEDPRDANALHELQTGLDYQDALSQPLSPPVRAQLTRLGLAHLMPSSHPIAEAITDEDGFPLIGELATLPEPSPNLREDNEDPSEVARARLCRLVESLLAASPAVTQTTKVLT